MKTSPHRPVLGKCWIALLAFAIFASLPAAAAATVLIYRTEFSRTGPHVNYPDPRWGYLLADPDAGTFTSVTVLLDPFSKELYYSTSLLAGRFFQATPLRRGGTHDVMNASTNNISGEFFAFQIAGPADRNLNVGAGRFLRLAARLDGYLLMSGSDRELEAQPRTRESIAAELGFVGTADVTAHLQRGATRRANHFEESAADVLGRLIEELEAIGIESVENGADPDPIPLPESPFLPDGPDPIPLPLDPTQPLDPFQDQP